MVPLTEPVQRPQSRLGKEWIGRRHPKSPVRRLGLVVFTWRYLHPSGCLLIGLPDPVSRLPVKMSKGLCCKDGTWHSTPTVSYPSVQSRRSCVHIPLSEISPPLPSGWFNWIVPVIKIPDATVLRHTSLDGFLFLRYLKVLGTICFVGICLTWPVLLPLHGTGGNGLTQLDLLTMGNVLKVSRFYAHVVISWCFFGKSCHSVAHTIPNRR